MHVQLIYTSHHNTRMCNWFTPVSVTSACATDSIVWDSDLIVRPYLFKEKDSDDDVMFIET
jgi:hypothetical protein